MAGLDPIDRYTARQLLDAVKDSVRRLDIRWPREALLGNWYIDLMKAGESGYESILLEPAEGFDNLADQLAPWLLGEHWFTGRTVYDLTLELGAWVHFQAENPDS